MPSVFTAPVADVNEKCFSAKAILDQAYAACESFHETYRALRISAGRGTTTDTQQDTLRAMLVFACAGLDASIKRLVRDALQSVIECDAGAQANFTESVKRRLPDMERSRDLLATVLTAANPRDALVQRLMSDLLADSLQSLEQLSKVAAAFNIKTNDLTRFTDLRVAFQVRNQIVHEMDVDFRSNRSRRSRRQADMERHTAVVLSVGSDFLIKASEKLSG